MNDAQMLAFSLTLMAVYIAPDLTPRVRYLAVVAYLVASTAIAARMLFKIFL